MTMNKTHDNIVNSSPDVLQTKEKHHNVLGRSFEQGILAHYNNVAAPKTTQHMRSIIY